MTQLVSQFQVTGLGTSRDECIDVLDATCGTIQDFVGGAPWMMMDDDIKRVQASQVSPPIGDSDGFCYLGVRTLIYRGPTVRMTSMIEHDGHKVQNSVHDV